MADIAATYISGTSFSAVADLSSLLEVGRRLRLDCGAGGIVTCYVVSATYSSGFTTVVVGGGTVLSTLVGFSYGIVGPSSLPIHTHVVPGVIAKYATMADIYAIASPEEGDLALALDIGMIMQYRDSVWVSAFTNPNICTVWSKYVDANTVQVQPGEIEINGAIVKVTKAKSVTLSGNLRSGLTEAASTIYYMYAVRPALGNDPTYVFDTVAPLMDRYGNLVASFEDCVADSAWFHPTLGLNYRWVGQVLNNASSNILAYDKCSTGYWESALTAIPAAGDYNLAHGFGRANFRPRIVASESLGGALYECSNHYHYGTTESYGVLLCNICVAGYAPKLSTSLSVRIAPFMYRSLAGPWSKAGYYKLILTSQ